MNFKWKEGANSFRGYDWIGQRNKALIRDNLTCQICGVQAEPIHVHHIMPYRISKDNALPNLICLCGKCHGKEENEFLRINKPSLRIRRIMETKFRYHSNKNTEDKK